MEKGEGGSGGGWVEVGLICELRNGVYVTGNGEAQRINEAGVL